ncbi:FimV/HubP family polar landmark protein [Vreelandella titanicae]|uniref:type IV pilus assembly protein FimV n=1 Tax=Vreelandella titanicae TaxID=664683 RepID=UPI00315B0D26
MKKSLTWIAWLSLSAVSPIALAVGFGQASVSSYLDAPLDASIPLLESSDYALDEIHISVAEPPAFASAGLEWTPLAASVRVQIQEQQGRRQVRLSSDKTMQEPWLDLLLTVELPDGQQFRDITLLFDPQGYAQNQALAQNAAPSSSAVSSAVTSPLAQPSSTPPSSAYVGSGDTLWSVAERIKPDEVSVQQMMLALLEANSEVFPSGNINDMRAEQTLRVPNSERILARSHGDADAAIKAMNEAWQQRRPGSLQTVALPKVEAATSVSATSIAADQAGVEEEVDEPEAITRSELTEQLHLSQATLQQVREERELMRAELDELRGEVASLTQALSDTLAAQEPPSAPLIASMDETKSPGVAGLIERYQWTLALAAITLLLALLAWLRKRREETWEDIPLAEPVVKPAASPRVDPKAENDALATNAAPTLDTDQWLVDDQGQTPSQDDPLRYEKSQASGLAEQGRQRRLKLHAVSADRSQNVSLAPPPSPMPMSQLLASIRAGMPASKPAAANAHVQQTDKPSETAEDPDHRFIDYHPPILNSASPTHDGQRTETPMQPTVEFFSESHAAPVPPAKQPRRPVEEEWEIEEVAFKPRGLDNSDPSKSSK